MTPITFGGTAVGTPKSQKFGYHVEQQTTAAEGFAARDDTWKGVAFEAALDLAVSGIDASEVAAAMHDRKARPASFGVSGLGVVSGQFSVADYSANEDQGGVTALAFKLVSEGPFTIDIAAPPNGAA